MAHPNTLEEGYSRRDKSCISRLGDGRRLGKDVFHFSVMCGHLKLGTPYTIAMMTYEALMLLPLFQGLNPQDLSLLAELVQRETFPEGTIIFNQGGRADKLYVLTSGRVAIRFKPEDGETLTVTEVEEGGVFGWSSALGRAVYTSCAVCIIESQAIIMQGDELRELCATHPETGVIILERLAEVIAERLRNTHIHVVEMLRQGMRSTPKS